MRKIFYTLLMTVAAFVLTSCSSTPTAPGAVAKTTMEYMLDGNMDKFIDGVYFEEALSKEEMDAVKPLMSLMLKGAIELMDAQGGVSKIEIVKEDINEANGTAVVTLRTVFGNGESSEEDVEMIKDKNGKWKMIMD